MPPRTRFAAPQDIRYVGPIGGRYSLAPADGPDAGKAEIYACCAVSLSPTIAVLTVPVVAPAGRQIVLMLDHIGLIRGTVSRSAKTDLHVAITATAAEREKLAAKINWLKKHRHNQADNARDAKRWRPKNPKGVFSLDDGSEHPCFIVDVSASGAAISGGVVPAIGTPVRLGELPGVVVRHTETGFGIRFQATQQQSGLEASIGARPTTP